MGRSKGAPTEMARPHILPGSVVWDVGAHEGTFAAFAHDLGAHVLAIEPSAAILPRLREKPGLTVLDVAISDQEGTATLYHANDTKQDSLIEGNVDMSVGRGTSDVCTQTLDRLFAERGAPAVIKMDVQGAESRVLAGGLRLLRAHHPVIVTECWPAGLNAAGASAMSFYAQFVALGYEVRWDCGDPVTAEQIVEWTVEKGNSPQEHVNWLAVPR